MGKVKTVRISLDSFGSYLGMEKGAFLIRDKDGKETRYPLFESEIGEIQVRTGNLVSSGALASLAYWQIDTLFLTGRGRPIAVLRSLEDNSHVSTRVSQYRSLENNKFQEVAKQFVLAKLEGQNQVLSKYGLRRLDYSHFEKVRSLEERDARTLRIKLTNIEGACSRRYFDGIFPLFLEFLRPKGRKTFKAYDKLNNLFNLGYEMLSWRVHLALLRARLEPFLGYLHAPAWGKPSLICDFVEVYRYLIDDFIIGYSRKLNPQDFVLKADEVGNRKGKREYLNDLKTRAFMKSLEEYFRSQVKIPRIRMGKKQELETLVSEECCLFAKYLRDEKPTWHPRIVTLS